MGLWCLMCHWLLSLPGPPQGEWEAEGSDGRMGWRVPERSAAQPYQRHHQIPEGGRRVFPYQQSGMGPRTVYDLFLHRLCLGGLPKCVCIYTSQSLDESQKAKSKNIWTYVNKYVHMHCQPSAILQCVSCSSVYCCPACFHLRSELWVEFPFAFFGIRPAWSLKALWIVLLTRHDFFFFFVRESGGFFIICSLENPMNGILVYLSWQ